MVYFTEYKHYETDEAPKQKLPPRFEHKSKIMNGKHVYFINSNGNFLTITKANIEVRTTNSMHKITPPAMQSRQMQPKNLQRTKTKLVLARRDKNKAGAGM